MILDTIGNCDRYFVLHPQFRSVLQTLKVMRTIEAEKLVIDGENAFILLSEQQGKKSEEACLEVHKKYIDIHFCFEGEEKIGWRALETCASVDKPFDESKDFLTFQDKPESWIYLKPGSFAIFFPEDAHAPMVSEGIVKKAVAKIAI